MPSLDMSKLARKSTRDRAQTEAEIQAGVEQDGRRRLRSGKEKAILYRCTPERREQIQRLADVLSAGKTYGRPASFTDTMDAALDALEEKLRGKK
jgi:hypothetical protein